MTDREFRRLTREDLLDIIYELQQKTQRLEQENETIRKQLSDRTVKLENAGSIAEAALALNGVFEAAQAAADQYLAQVHAANEQSQQLADRIVADAQRKATAIVQQAQQLLVLVRRLGGELGHGAAVIRSCFKFRVFAVLCAQKSVCQRRKCNKSDLQFFKDREQCLIIAIHHRITILHCSYRADCVSSSKRLLIRLGNSPVGDLSCLDQFFHGARRFLYGNIPVDAVNIIQIQMVRLKTSQ